MVATAVFQTAIIILGLKSQKVQVRSKRMLSFLHPMSCVGLHVPNPLAEGLFFKSIRDHVLQCVAGVPARR